MLIIYFLLLAVSAFVLIKSSEQAIVAARRIGNKLGTGTFLISVLVLALGTSLPELFVGINSSVADKSSLSLGNIMGANVANLSLIAGMAALVVGHVSVHGGYIKKDIALAFAAGLLPLVLAIDGNLSRLDGIVLLISYAAFTYVLISDKFAESGVKSENAYWHRFWMRFSHVDSSYVKEFIRLFVSLVFLLLSANFVVKLAIEISEIIHLPVFLVGLLVISVGTTLPEMVLSLRCLEDNQPSVFFGNILGSIVINSTLIVGLAAFISPVKDIDFSHFARAAAGFVAAFIVFGILSRKSGGIGRLGATLLLIVYIMFVVVQFL